MSSVSIQKISEGRGIPPLWLTKLLEFSEQVRHRAFELFEESGRPHGHDVNHWLEAEKQMPSVPRYELLETRDGIEVCIAIPGFDADEIGLVALPDALLVKADSHRGHEPREGSIRYSEFDDQNLFRRIPLPAGLDVARVTASLDKGMLTVMVPRVIRTSDVKEGCTCYESD